MKILPITFQTASVPAATVWRQGEDIEQKCSEGKQEHHHEAHKDSR
jgi:hypothetical protein